MRRLCRDFIAAFHYLKRAYRKDEEELFVRKCSDRMKGSSFKLKDKMTKFFTMRVVRHWNWLTSEDGGCIIFGSVQTVLDGDFPCPWHGH